MWPTGRWINDLQTPQKHNMTPLTLSFCIYVNFEVWRSFFSAPGPQSRKSNSKYVHSIHRCLTGPICSAPPLFFIPDTHTAETHTSRHRERTSVYRVSLHTKLETPASVSLAHLNLQLPRMQHTTDRRLVWGMLFTKITLQSLSPATPKPVSKKLPISNRPLINPPSTAL